VCTAIIAYVNTKLPAALALDTDFALPKIRGSYKQTGVAGEDGMDMVLITDHLDAFLNSSGTSSSSTTRGSSSKNADTKTVPDKKPPVPAADRNSSSSASRNSTSTATAAAAAGEASAGQEKKAEVPAMKVGMLKKDGHGLISSWKSRHFVLLQGKLTYYEKSSSSPPYGESEKGSTNLANMQISQIPQISQFRMKLDHMTDKKIKSYVIEAASQKELQDWILAIDEHIEFATSNRK
jgi:hypothetical protein